MKRGRIPLWLLRDLPALIGIAWSFWPLMILVISSGRRAMRGKQVDRSVYDALMQMLPIAEAKLRFALHRQAYRALGWNPRAIALDPVDPVASWSNFRVRFEAYRASMMDLHASITFFIAEHRRLHHIRTRADANAARASHAWTGARSAATYARGEAARLLSSNYQEALMLSSAQSARPSKHERGLANARGPPVSPLAIRNSPRKPSLPGSRPHACARPSR